MIGWLAVNKDGKEVLFKSNYPPYRESFQRDFRYPKTFWATDSVMDMEVFHHGMIEKIIGRELSWEDEPVKIDLEKSDFFCTFAE